LPPFGCGSYVSKLRFLRGETFAPTVGANSALNRLALVRGLEELAQLTTLIAVWLILVVGFRFFDLLLLGLALKDKVRARITTSGPKGSE
jgi:hypothetical protein